MSKEYDRYLKEHIMNVMKAYDWLIENLPEVVHPNGEVERNLIWHDLSKYSSEEYDAYDRYFYGSKGNISSEVLNNFNRAWLHHIHHNPHHWQHWVLHEDEGEVKALEMPSAYVIEMISDWMSFSIKKGDVNEVVSWYEKHSPTMILHKNTRRMVDTIIKAIDEGDF